jgi:glycosyltransferase involved in cell wall biosynthesis
LAEAIESYLRQDYDGPSELIIVNDFEGITISIDNDVYGERIKIVNLPKRMGSLNDKFDLGVKMAQYPLVAMWDDDDISLSHRLSQAAHAWQVLAEPDYIGMTHHWYLDAGKAPKLVARGIHGGDIFTKACYTALGGSAGEGHNDENFVAKVKADARYVEWYNGRNPAYIYRWGGITAHNSCYARDLKTCMARFHADVVRDRRFIDGKLHVLPGWGDDFEAMVTE